MDADGHAPISGTFDPKTKGTADADDEAQGKSSSPGRVNSLKNRLFLASDATYARIDKPAGRPIFCRNGS